MRRAEARFNASIISSNSIRCSSTGRHVGCITKTSQPRTFSWICTYASPSAKRVNMRLPTLHAEKLANFVGQRLVRRAAENLELLVHARTRLAFRLLLGHGRGLLFGFLRFFRRRH